MYGHFPGTKWTFWVREVSVRRGSTVTISSVLHVTFTESQTAANEQLTVDHSLKYQRKDGQTRHENIRKSPFHLHCNVIRHGFQAISGRNMLDDIGLHLKKVNREEGFCHNRLFFHLITYILSPRIFVDPPRYTLLCPKSRFTDFPEATAVKRCSRFTISVPCSPSRMISTWCHPPSGKVKSVDIIVTPCPRLNLFQKAQKAGFTNQNYIHW